MHHGLGQRLLATDADETPVMDVRRIAIDAGTEPEQDAGGRSRMADAAPSQDRLQPALLDRLTDEEPDRKLEPREQRALSKARLRQAVLRDLAWLFNTVKLESSVDLARARRTSAAR